MESKKGESFASLAKREGLTGRQLAQFNPKARTLKTGNLAPGQAILVPTALRCRAATPLRSVDRALFDVARVNDARREVGRDLGRNRAQVSHDDGDADALERPSPSAHLPGPVAHRRSVVFHPQQWFDEREDIVGEEQGDARQKEIDRQEVGPRVKQFFPNEMPETKTGAAKCGAR